MIPYVQLQLDSLSNLSQPTYNLSSHPLFRSYSFVSAYLWRTFSCCVPVLYFLYLVVVFASCKLWIVLGIFAATPASLFSYESSVCFSSPLLIFLGPLYTTLQQKDFWTAGRQKWDLQKLEHSVSVRCSYSF